MPGYADYQRTVNYDDPLLLDDVGGAELEKTITRGRFDVSRFAYVMGKLQFTKVPMEVTLQWFMTETGGEPIGERAFWMDNKAAVSADLHVANMGPWLAVVYKPAEAAVKYKPAVRLFPSSRVLPFETIPRQPYVLKPANFKLAAKGVKNFLPNMYFAGPALVSIRCTGTGGIAFGVEGFLSGAEYTPVGVYVSATTTLNAALLLPFTAQNFAIENSSAAENEYILAVIPSITGSS